MMSSDRKIIIRRGPHLAGLRLVLAGVTLALCRAYLRSGDTCMAALLPEDAPEVERAVKLTGGRLTLGVAAQVEGWVDEPHDLEPSLEVSAGRTLADVHGRERPAPVRAALQWGWTESDLEGAGAGERWGPEGGRSTRSGLTVAEMALVPPPPAWADQAETVWPWDLDGWRSPGIGWEPPRVPGKGANEPEGEADDEASADTSSAPDVESGEPEQEAEAVEYTEADADLLADALDAGQLAEARQVVAELLVESGGEEPHRNKINYHLKKRSIPTLNQEQVDALTRAVRA